MFNEIHENYRQHILLCSKAFIFTQRKSHVCYFSSWTVLKCFTMNWEPQHMCMTERDYHLYFPYDKIQNRKVKQPIWGIQAAVTNGTQHSHHKLSILYKTIPLVLKRKALSLHETCKSPYIELNKYISDLGGQQRAGKKLIAGNEKHWSSVCLPSAMSCFHPQLCTTQIEFADVLFIKQEHWGMQITERKVKEWINQWREKEAPSDVITRFFFHRFQEGYARSY